MSDFSVGENAQCPHCGRVVQFANGDDIVLSGSGPLGKFSGCRLHWVQCPACGKLTIVLEQVSPQDGSTVEAQVIHPLCTQRAPVPSEVPSAMAADYEEAASILPLSAKGSAALSRRCLETVLVGAGRATPEKKLSQQIDEVKSELPGYLVKMLDQVRTIGNFAAHPDKDTTTAAIIDVEPGEAEWNLNVLDQLFDFYYVKPAAIMRTTDQLNEKLKAAGKRTI